LLNLIEDADGNGGKYGGSDAGQQKAFHHNSLKVRAASRILFCSRCGRSGIVYAGPGLLLLQPETVVLPCKINIDGSGAHRLERTFRTDRADVDVRRIAAYNNTFAISELSEQAVSLDPDT
jgi:hypothetical protein